MSNQNQSPESKTPASTESSTAKEGRSGLFIAGIGLGMLVLLIVLNMNC